MDTTEVEIQYRNSVYQAQIDYQKSIEKAIRRAEKRRIEAVSQAMDEYKINIAGERPQDGK